MRSRRAYHQPQVPIQVIRAGIQVSDISMKSRSSEPNPSHPPEAAGPLLALQVANRAGCDCFTGEPLRARAPSVVLSRQMPNRGARRYCPEQVRVRSKVLVCLLGIEPRLTRRWPSSAEPNYHTRRQDIVCFSPFVRIKAGEVVKHAQLQSGDD